MDGGGERGSSLKRRSREIWPVKLNFSQKRVLTALDAFTRRKPMMPRRSSYALRIVLSGNTALPQQTTFHPSSDTQASHSTRVMF